MGRRRSDGRHAQLRGGSGGWAGGNSGRAGGRTRTGDFTPLAWARARTASKARLMLRVPPPDVRISRSLRHTVAHRVKTRKVRARSCRSRHYSHLQCQYPALCPTHAHPLHVPPSAPLIAHRAGRGAKQGRRRGNDGQALIGTASTCWCCTGACSTLPAASVCVAWCLDTVRSLCGAGRSRPAFAAEEGLLVPQHHPLQVRARRPPRLLRRLSCTASASADGVRRGERGSVHAAQTHRHRPLAHVLGVTRRLGHVDRV